MVQSYLGNKSIWKLLEKCESNIVTAAMRTAFFDRSNKNALSLLYYISISKNTSVSFSATNYCATNPCQNGGTCSPLFMSFTCACLPGYSGDRCQGKLQYVHSCNLSIWSIFSFILYYHYYLSNRIFLKFFPPHNRRRRGSVHLLQIQLHDEIVLTVSLTIGSICW